MSLKTGPEGHVRVAVLDWGIGGVDFYARLRAAHPRVPVIYWSDAGTTPYGKLGRDALAARVAAVADELRARGATHLVVACNAASTVLDHPRLRARVAAGLPIAGVIAPAIAAALADPARELGVVGGRRTIRSQVYRRGLRGRRVRQRVAQPLSARVERGELDGPELRAELARILAPLRRVDALVLACTHYTALLPPIRELLPRARIIDPAAATLADVAARWSLRGARPADPAVPSDMFLTTGDPAAMRRAARLAFAVDLPEIAGLPASRAGAPPHASARADMAARTRDPREI
jgi:glutamate racemase